MPQDPKAKNDLAQTSVEPINSGHATAPYNSGRPQSCPVSPTSTLINKRTQDRRDSSASINILSWNIAGWSSKLRIPDFTDLLKTYDIICLQETWMINPIIFVDYNIVSVPAVKSHSRGRPSGGLSIMIAPHIKFEYVLKFNHIYKLLVIKIMLKADCEYQFC